MMRGSLESVAMIVWSLLSPTLFGLQELGEKYVDWSAHVSCGQVVHLNLVEKERTSVVSTPSLAELFRFSMNFLLVRKRKRKRNRDGRKRKKWRGAEIKVKRDRTHG